MSKLDTINELLDTIEKYNNNGLHETDSNITTIKNTALFCRSWREEHRINKQIFATELTTTIAEVFDVVENTALSNDTYMLDVKQVNQIIRLLNDKIIEIIK